MDITHFLILLIPIIIICLLLAYTKGAVVFSNTILGKLCAVFLIAFYTNVDAIFGLLICVLVILYYQSDYVEGMLNVSSGYTGPFKYISQPEIIEDPSEDIDEDNLPVFINNIPSVDSIKQYRLNDNAGNELKYQGSGAEVEKTDLIEVYETTTITRAVDFDKIHAKSFIDKKILIEQELRETTISESK